jgi:hypothetical protein
VITDKRCTTCGKPAFPHPYRHPITLQADSVTTFEGRKYAVSGESWTSVTDIPVWTVFVPDFDDLIHPARKALYWKRPFGTYCDLSDGEEFSKRQFLKWWGWVPRFLEVTSEIRKEGE